MYQVLEFIDNHTPIDAMGWLTGLEPATLGTTNRCSNQLSYSHHITGNKCFTYLLNPDYAIEFSKKYFRLINCCYRGTFLMLCNRNVPDLMFGKLLGDARTLLPVSTAVMYIYTLLCTSVVKHTPHPIA